MLQPCNNFYIFLNFISISHSLVLWLVVVSFYTKYIYTKLIQTHHNSDRESFNIKTGELNRRNICLIIVVEYSRNEIKKV